jgi:GH35 family endo-1,4-beta-xylanase
MKEGDKMSIAQVMMLAILMALLVRPAFAQGSPEALRERTDAAIRRHRMGRLTILAEPGAEVRVEQERHAFQFGSALSNRFFNGSMDDEPEALGRALQIIRDNFNVAVPENAMKWGHVERERGRERWETFDRMLEFCERNGITVRGHCLLWAFERFLPPWVRELEDDELREAVDKRIRDTLERYRGRVVEHDLNNEMILGHFFRDRLGEGIRAHMFKVAHDIAPETPMYVNDFRILKGGGLDGYVEQIQGLLDAGAPVGGIGIQAHPRDGIPPAEQIQTALDRLGQFNLPIKITEFCVGEDAGGDAAAQVERLYRVAFAHPAVEGILMWGFWEGAHWRPQAALWRRDFTLTPAGEAFRRLVFEEWWTDDATVAGQDGQAEVTAFFGTHTVTVNGEARRVELTPEAGDIQVDMR